MSTDEGPPERPGAAEPTLYFDLGSPYAYLALERAAEVLGREPRLQPVLLVGIVARRGFGSWSATAVRAPRIEEIEARARRYGLPPLRWPERWPGNGLQAMRASVWAQHEGAIGEFARAVFRSQFERGEDIADAAMLRACAGQAGLDPQEMTAACERAAIKDALREATDAAWEAGVRGVPSMALEDVVFYGDDQLELAAAALSAG
jgi:2-hydroxychromene-2-carboxylate isomerase